ncbi:MAG: hypothetical protein AB1744_05095 [Candidatus Zixiibacteriota bacterium]
MTVVGIEPRTDCCLLARSEYSEHGRRITDLAKIARQHVQRHPLLQTAELVIAVPDDKVMVKSLRVGKAEAEDIICFELAHTILDSEQNYLWDAIRCGMESNRYLGLLARREEIQKVTQTMVSGLADIARQARHSEQVRYEVRAVALAKGFVEFCEQTEAELYCLVDASSDMASLAFVQNRSILDLACISTERLRSNTTLGVQYFAAELKTVIDFRLRSLREHLESSHPPTVVLSGNTELLDILGSRLQAPVVHPLFNPDLIADSAKPFGAVIDDFLIALGLTVK